MKALMQNKKGFALVTALLIMFALSVIGIVAVNSSIVENWMTTNTKVSKQAFFLAEAGAQEAKEILRQRIMDQGSSLTDQINLVKGGDGVLGTADDLPFVSKTLGAGNYNVKLTDDSGQTALGIITLTSTGSGPMNSRAVVKQGVQAVNNPPTTETRTVRDPAFDVGIITNRDLLINGGAFLDGGTHSNRNTRINGTSTIHGSVSAVGTITTSGRVDITGERRQNLLVGIPVPDVDSILLNNLRAAAGVTNYHEGSFTLNGGTAVNSPLNLGNQVIYVNGDLTLNGHVFNGTLVATGNVTINGSSQIINGYSDTAIISWGNIVMNGTTDCYGAFWSHGSFVQNGSSNVTGSIVSMWDITRNGDFHFTQRGGIHNDYLPTVTTTVTIPGTITYRVLGWKQG
jgi:cytoskeletal protein CcmA (bactofilin family)